MPESDNHIAFIAVGSNQGDKTANCRFGIEGMEQPGRCRVTGRSRFFRTAPVDYLNQDWFINAAFRVETRWSPRELLENLKIVQKKAGRTQSPIRFGPRVLDLDIIFYDDLVLSSEDLTLPHPRMHKRRFVLEPLCDIDPRVVHPVLKQDLKRLLDAIDDPGQEIFPLND
ncbi:MAG: 2-amino-4-hydroxy-6-hydroxymethyldihydropteridine diphosphokinase [Desulfobacterales bacterium]